VLQCVAVCCSVLQCVAVCCSVLQCVAVCCSSVAAVYIRYTICICNTTLHVYKFRSTYCVNMYAHTHTYVCELCMYDTPFVCANTTLHMYISAHVRIHI